MPAADQDKPMESDEGARLGGGSDPEPQCATRDAAERLERLADQVEAFLMDQIRQLEHQFDSAGEPQPQEEQVKALMQAYRAEREQWELERQREQDQLRREGAALAEAWKQLEQELRSLLAERERIQATGHHASQINTPRPNLAQPGRSPEEVQCPTAADDANWLQLKQLRREIGKHARRNR